MLDLDELEQMEEIIKQSFTDVPWSSPKSNLSPEDFCKVSLIDFNESGAEKVKAKCKLPVRSTPGGPFNKGAIRNALARISQVKGAPADKVAAARRRLETLARQAGIGVRKDVDGNLVLIDDGELEDAPVVENDTYTILKAETEGELRLVYGVVLRPNVVDAQGDFYDEGEVRKAAHAYLIKSRRHDLRHQELIGEDKVQLVESFIDPVGIVWGDGLVTKQGDWIIVSHVDDDQIWKDVKSGDIKSFSIVGTGKRTPTSV
jgi:hypothetical protein